MAADQCNLQQPTCPPAHFITILLVILSSLVMLFTVLCQSTSQHFADISYFRVLLHFIIKFQQDENLFHVVGIHPHQK
jgi:hypothetical protein